MSTSENKPRLHETRLRPKTEAVLEMAFWKADFQTAMVLLAGLLGKNLKQVWKNVEFDKGSGKPIGQGWRVIEDPWDGEMLLGKHDSFVPHESPFFKTAIKYIPPGGACVYKDLVLIHVPKFNEDGGTTPPKLVIKKSVTI